MLIKTMLDGGCMVSTESAIIKAEPYSTDGEVHAYVSGKKIRIGVYQDMGIACMVMDEIYFNILNGARAYTMPDYDYEREDFMAKLGEKFIIEIESVMTNKNGTLYGIKGVYPLCISEKDLDKLEKHSADQRYLDGKSDGMEMMEGEYERGLNDAWEAARKLNGMGYKESCEIFGSKYQGDEFWQRYTAAEAISKIKAYEEQKKAEEEIKVGDEIEYKLFGDTVKAVVIQVVEIDDGGYKVLCENGCGQVLYKTEQPITKTGKHFDIDGILKIMREE